MENVNIDSAKMLIRKLGSVRYEYYVIKWYTWVNKYYDRLLYNKYFGFSEDNKGMSYLYSDPTKTWDHINYMQDAPVHEIRNWQEPEAMNFIEVLFGRSKPMNQVIRTAVNNEHEGYYAFTHQNFRNLYYLSDNVSSFLQLRLHQTFASDSEIYLTVAYDFVVFYAAAYSFRLTMSWFLYINIYSVPWVYLSTGLDWMEECFGGSAPTLGGTSSIGVIISSALGYLSDCMNHLVFTMPYLPSEGEHWQKREEFKYALDPVGRIDDKQLVNGMNPDQLVKYHFFPRLWYLNGVPDSVRRDWFEKNTYYLEYYHEHYGLYKIQMLPNYILSEFPEWKDTTNVTSEIIEKIVLLDDSERTIKGLHELFDTPSVHEVLSVQEIVPVSIISESLDAHFSLINLVNPDLIQLQTVFIQESKVNFNINFMQQYFEHVWSGNIHNFF